MCTLTAVPLPTGTLRLAFNRDEQRTRSPGLPPTRRRFGDRRAVFPTDPKSGGTWLAVNDAGLILALLNVSTEHVFTDWTSRGRIIPSLLHHDTPAAALDSPLEYRDFAPFRLVLVGSGVVADVRWDGREPMAMTRLLGGTPLLFTSSGLGDRLVEAVRRPLFEESFAGPPDSWANAQDIFHRHRWPGREHLSVNMARADARTVSRAVVTVADEVTFDYFADDCVSSVSLPSG